MKQQRIRIDKFLRLNGWKFDLDSDYPEHAIYHKDGCVSVDMTEDEIVFIDGSGDFNHQPLNYYALIGVLICNRQISASFKEVLG